jgi:hypothetical protein
MLAVASLCPLLMLYFTMTNLACALDESASLGVTWRGLIESYGLGDVDKV